VEIPAKRQTSTQELEKLAKKAKPKISWRDVLEEGTRAVEEA